MMFCLSAGRREPVTLAKVLKFVTGRENEPLFGFHIAPTIHFDEYISMPQSNTCTCSLRLPYMNADYSRDLLDYAFVNDYFGIV